MYIKTRTDARNRAHPCVHASQSRIVMANDRQYATKTARLHRTAAECRLRAIESQLSLGFTLCAIAETEIRYSRPAEAIKVVNKLRHHAETISFHIDEPNHLPTTAIPDLRKQLTQLTRRIEEIALCLRQR